jgi:cytidylate kinase
MYRVLTVAREYGSGGGKIARIIATRLRWSLLDNDIITRIAQAAKVDPELARRYDERVDSWAHRITRGGIWHGTFERVTASDRSTEAFDAETMAVLTRNIVSEAHAQGNCVIVGRGAQCILQNRDDVFHVFVYGPWAQRVARARGRFAETADVPELVRIADHNRRDYIRLHFGCNWEDPHLYNLLLSSALGDEAAADTIICGMKLAGVSAA